MTECRSNYTLRPPHLTAVFFFASEKFLISFGLLTCFFFPLLTFVLSDVVF